MNKSVGSAASSSRNSLVICSANLMARGDRSLVEAALVVDVAAVQRLCDCSWSRRKLPALSRELTKDERMTGSERSPVDHWER
jgi:hypothetical protein